jgi:hypothetical protein
MIRCFLLLLLIVGCQDAVQTPDEIFILPPPQPVEREKEIQVDMPANVVASIFRYAGAKNTIKAAAGWSIALPSLKVDLPPGTSISYELTEAGGSVIFNEPKPKVTVWVRGIPLHPTLDKVVLTAPSKATVHAREFGKRTFDIDLDPDAPPGVSVQALNELTAESAPRRVLYLLTTTGCPPCDRAKKALLFGPKLSFDLVIDPPYKLHGFGGTYPFLQYAVDGKIKFSQTGWNGLPALLAKIDPPAKVASRRDVRRMAAFTGRHWGVTGMTVRHHLTAHHGFSEQELVGFSEAELYRIHSACHEDD